MRRLSSWKPYERSLRARSGACRPIPNPALALDDRTTPERPMILFRRRTVWVPTARGWLLILAVVGAAGVAAVRGLHPFLAVDERAGARVLVIEGWLAPEQLDQAVRIYQAGGYERIYTTGGPVLGWQELAVATNYAQLAADYLARHGVPRERIAAVPAPASAQERTFLSAVMLRRFAMASERKLDAIDLVSVGAHARRSRLLYEMALGPESRVGVIAARPTEYDSAAWWRTTRGVSQVVVQAFGYAWVKCCFWPGPRGSSDERWGAASMSKR